MTHFASDPWQFLGWNPWAGLQDCATGAAMPAPAPGQGSFVAGVFEFGAHTLHYKLFIPSNAGAASLPLVVMLHGCGQGADDFALGTGMNALAEQAGCMVLYPEQSPQAHWNRCWNWYDQAHHERDEGEPALIAGLVQHVIAEYGIDRSRVAVAGLSSGGAMAVILGRTYPDVFSAVGCHSGLAHRSAFDGASAMMAMREGAGPDLLESARPLASIPTIVFHGDVDYTVHQNNSADVIRQALACYAGQVPGLARETAMCEHTGETSGRSFTRHTHHGETGDVVAERWIVHGTGHAWSGGSSQGSYTDARGPDASKEMLRFFMKQ
ncbi:PHB depolymerase family esterase [Massilia sp. H6]|uniref:extracellular catalytic domain type 1 short-chain-length polyhydroxyalkanoate depolymerase n=1 Tax=Massilia sp. H6 TaxID=2970464 RepID=UPI0021697481|nr:PHB depolymerase family esterase [Massilia sp. H6]UVW29971.1 PHB depolymerase family esterase [Massilia sp. H6]